MNAPAEPVAASLVRPGAREVVGRALELDAIDRFLARLSREPAAIVFEGRPGIGKTTVWGQVFERTGGRSLTVLACRPVEAETKLAFASLADLLEPVAESILPALPEPQRLALEVALMRARPPGTPPSARAVATAMLSALRALAATSPVMIAIDDQQWLDRASAEALAFALRRVGEHRIGVAAAVRVEDEAASDALALDHAFAGNVERLRLGPLTLGGLHHVIRTHLDHVFPRPTLRRIGEASDGNPFFALELARTVIDAGAQPGPGEPLPVPGTLMNLVARRMERLPSRTRDVLLIVAALSAPTVSLVRRTAGEDSDPALERARQAGVIDIDGERIRFTHPLLASSVYSSAAPPKRRELHGRIAQLMAEPEERARHLALAASQPDEDVARALDVASVLARRRGAPDTAAELQEQAARLTIEDELPARRRRRTQAAQYFVHAGDRGRARALLEGVLGEAPAGEERARALRLLGEIRGQESSFADAIACFDEALVHAEDAASRVAIKLELASAIFNAGDIRRAVSIADEALADAERIADPGIVADALCLVVLGRFLTGQGLDRVDLERALALEDRSRATQLELRPTSIAGIIAVYDGRFAEGHALLREMCEWAAERGEESGLPFLLFNLSWLEWWRGDFAASIARADEGRVIAEQSSSETMRALALVHRARARGTSGDVAGARADMAEGRRLLDATGYARIFAWLLSDEAMLELSLDDAEAAARAIDPLVGLVEALGDSEPFADFVADGIEALARIGQTARAESVLAMFAKRASTLARPWQIASAARCRSILASAAGDLDAALAAAEEAAARCESLEVPIERGRALLALGQIRRRRGDRRMAREALERSRDVFRAAGASIWAERAAEELGRIPIRRGATLDLTPTEERVAELAAAGRTNLEVAQALFMSPKTVEANLTRVYGKLGIRSRAELGARMLERRTKHPKK